MSNSKGVVSPIVIGVVLAIAAIGGYFFLSQIGSLPLPSVTNQGTNQLATEKAFDFIDDPILRKHFVAQANQTTYRIETTSPGTGLKTEMEVQIKGESFNNRAIESDGSKEIKHTVTIGDTIYLKDYSDNTWWKQILKADEVSEEESGGEPVDFKEEYSKPQLSFKSLGKESCGQHTTALTCYKYEQTDPENPEIKRIFWFDDKDYLLRKEESGFGEFIATTEYSYDGINIQAPSPTKDVPEGKNIYEYSNNNVYIPQGTEFDPSIDPNQYMDLNDYSSESSDY